LRIIFAGTPAFAAAALAALLDSGHDVVHVLTQPDRPAGRGLKPQASAVKQLALARQLPLAQPATLKDAALIAQLADLQAEVMVVAAYGLMIPQPLLQLPPRGCLNIHASLLPRWRGAAPIQRAILAGDRESGVTIMQMDMGLDTGAMLLTQTVTIAADEMRKPCTTNLQSPARNCCCAHCRNSRSRCRRTAHAQATPRKSTRPKRISTGRDLPLRSTD